MLWFTTAFSYAQSLAGDHMYGDTLRVFTTSDVICRSFTDRMVLSVSLSRSLIKDGNSFYMINFEVNQMGQCYIPTDGRVLIKTEDDSVIELHSVTSSNSKAWTYNGGTYTRYNRIGNTIYSHSGNTGVTSNRVIGHYVVSEEDLQKMFNGVKKVKMEINPKNYEKTFSKDKVGKALLAEYNILKGKEFRESNDNFKDGF